MSKLDEAIQIIGNFELNREGNDMMGDLMRVLALLREVRAEQNGDVNEYAFQTHCKAKTREEWRAKMKMLCPNCSEANHAPG